MTLSAQNDCDFEIDLGPDFNLPIGETYPIFLAISIPLSAVENISWTPDSTLSCNDCVEPVTSTTVDVCYIAMVTDTAGCTVNDTLCVFIQTTTRLEDLRPQDVLLVFPNPAEEVLHLSTNGEEMGLISLFNSSGARVRTMDGELSSTRTLNISMLPPGLYILTVWLDHQLIRKKLLIQ